jgi:hypothetical protein
MLAPATSALPAERPTDPLARGRWEAPAWAIAMIAAFVVFGGIAYFARRAFLSRREPSRSSVPPFREPS